MLLLLLPINVALDLSLFLDVGCCFAPFGEDPFRVAINGLFLLDGSFGKGFLFDGGGHYANVLVLFDGGTIGSTLVVHVVHGRSCLFGLVIDMLLVHVVKVVFVPRIGRTRLVVAVAAAAALLGRFRNRRSIGLTMLKLCIAKTTTAKTAAATVVATPSRGG